MSISLPHGAERCGASRGTSGLQSKWRCPVFALVPPLGQALTDMGSDYNVCTPLSPPSGSVLILSPLQVQSEPTCTSLGPFDAMSSL